MIKLSDYVAEFLAGQGVKCVFGVSGGASLHLIHSVKEHDELAFICPHHEQNGAMAADGYARAIGNIGVAVSTSGPGATNMITGMCCSYYDSVPVLYLTGQVSTFREVGETGVRQIGFQETPITEIAAPITKYCVKIDDPNKIKYELEKAVSIARSGRPGPVLIDIPDNLQRERINHANLPGFDGEGAGGRPTGLTAQQKKDIYRAIDNTSRPVLVAGWGIYLSGSEGAFRHFAESLNIPVAVTWGAPNILEPDHPLYVGTFGTHGTRSANFAVQNADLVIALGSRLDTKATGTPVDTFARGAVKVAVDIDRAELDKFSHFGLAMDLLIHDDLRHFFDGFADVDLAGLAQGYDDWFSRIESWKSLDKTYGPGVRPGNEGVNPYDFFDRFSEKVPIGSKVFVDTGCAVAWMMQASRFDPSCRVFHDCNNTAMGWALPASIGGYFADPASPHYCVMGDGALMMTMQELATVRHHEIPLKLMLVNNGGYSMIKQTQDQWLGSQYHASGANDLGFPDYRGLADSFGLSYVEILEADQIEDTLEKVARMKGAVFCNLVVSPEARVQPQVKYGRANEDMEPLLPRDVFHNAMIVPPLPESE